MIRLELSLSDAEQLQQWLSLLLATPASQTERAQVQLLLDRLISARNSAYLEQICPVCQQPFTQEKRGRSGRYCSNACKQKAYRQRRDSWHRHYGPNYRP